MSEQTDTALPQAGASTPRAAQIAAIARAYAPLEPSQSYTADPFRPEDAPGIARLFYGAYGDRFPIDYVYDPQAIVALNTGPDLYHVVGRTPRGDIVAVCGLYRNPPGTGIMESGSTIVDPNYSAGKLLLRMQEMVNRDLPRTLGLNALFGQSVCDHLVTQKLCVRFAARPYALELGALAPRPEERDYGSRERVSLLDAVQVFEDIPHAVHLPAIYRDCLEPLYARHGLQRTILPDCEPSRDVTEAAIARYPDSGMIKMTVVRLGRDVPERIQHLTEDDSAPQVLHLVLPLTEPGVAEAVAAARAQGFFLGGLLPLWNDRDMLLMQRLACPFDPARIKLLTDDAKALLDAILADREQVRARLAGA
ncbi:hypothetical protein CCR95_11045 [Thiocystis minor]|uniref:hypothetical protein n=1 Tax=Thiocystis minor TaxID=61597 RepID=UPI0019124600|nr:hypothetical protein [Thiocystis minor]MBK5964601.1 hypothetical protein [Thiocystis minor]